MITVEQFAEAIRASLDLKFDSEYYEGDRGGGFHQHERFRVDVEPETETLLLGNDSFYGVPLNIPLLREQLKKLGIELE